MDAVHSKRADIDRECAGRLAQITQASLAAAQLRQRRDQRRAEMESLESQLAQATERREAGLAAVSEASARLASVEGERRSLLAMREQHDKSIERLDSQIAAKKLQVRNMELEASVIDERLGKLTHELETIRTEQARYAVDAAPDRDELHRLENHERTIQDEYNEAQEQLLAIDRKRLDLEAELARTSEHIEHLRLEMEREGLAPDRTGRIVSFDEAMVADSMFDADALQAPRIQGGADGRYPGHARAD